MACAAITSQACSCVVVWSTLAFSRSPHRARDLGEAFAAAGLGRQRQQGGAVAQRPSRSSRCGRLVVHHLARLGEGEPRAAGLGHMVQRGRELRPGEAVADLAAFVSWK